MSEQPAAPVNDAPQTATPKPTRLVGDNLRTFGVIVASLGGLGLLFGMIAISNGAIEGGLFAVASGTVAIAGFLMLCAGYLAQIAAQGEARK